MHLSTILSTKTVVCVDKLFHEQRVTQIPLQNSIRFRRSFYDEKPPQKPTRNLFYRHYVPCNRVSVFFATNAFFQSYRPLRLQTTVSVAVRKIAR